MTPQFTTPCFVRIDDADKRKEVCGKLQEMGYAMNFLPKTLGFSTRNSVLVNGMPFYGEYREPSCFLQNYRAGLAKSTEIDGWQFIDCGTNIDLFLALAGMRKDTDKGQWFITEQNEWFVSKYDSQHLYPCERTIDDVKIGIRNVRKATAAEIIEHFNRQTK